jgi:outer membrane autotransporter protein
MDYILDRQWVVGFTAGHTHADLSLKPSTVSHQADGALVGPYASYIVNPHVALDALFNYTSLSNTLSSPAPFPSGNYHSDRLTGTTDLNVFTDYGPFKLTGYGGYTYSWEGGNVASVLSGIALGNNIRYGAIRLGGEAAYQIGPALEAYLPVMFEYETTRSIDESSRAALIPGVGLRYRWSDTLSGGLLFQTTEIKTHTQDYLIGAHLRWSF